MFVTLIISALSIGVLALLVWGATKAIKRSASKYPPADPSHKLAGVGGWLLFLIVKLMLIGPLMELSTLSNEIAQMEATTPELIALASWTIYKKVLWSICGVVIAISLATGIFLVRNRTRAAVRRAIVAVWLIGPGSLIALLAAAPILDWSLSEAAGQLMGTFITGGLGAILWTAYLVLSKRVRATYGPVPLLT